MISKKIDNFYREIVDDYYNGIDNNQHTRYEMKVLWEKFLHNEEHKVGVICDETNNPPDLVYQHLMRVLIYYQPFRTSVLKYVQLLFGKDIITVEGLRKKKLRRIING